MSGQPWRDYELHNYTDDSTNANFSSHQWSTWDSEISSNIVKASEEKVKAILDWPQPSTVRDIRSFLGLANYYRRFIQDYSKIAKPLTDLTSEKVKFQWGQDQDAAFNRLKYALTTSPILRLPNFELEVHPDH